MHQHVLSERVFAGLTFLNYSNEKGPPEGAAAAVTQTKLKNLTLYFNT